MGGRNATLWGSSADEHQIRQRRTRSGSSDTNGDVTAFVKANTRVRTPTAARQTVKKRKRGEEFSSPRNTVVDIDEAPSSCNNQTPPSAAEDQLKNTRTRNWGIPPFLGITMETLLTQCISESYPSVKERKIVIFNMTPQNVSLLTETVSLIVELISDRIIEEVLPKAVSRVSLRKNCENITVTEEEILECLGNSVDYGLEAALGLRSQPASAYRMRTLIAAEVTNRVNSALAVVTQSGKLRVKPPVSLMDPKSVVTRFAIILRLADPKTPEPFPEDSRDQDSVGSSVLSEMTYRDQENPSLWNDNCDQARSESEDLSEEDFPPGRSGFQDLDSAANPCSSHLEYSDEELLERDRYFIAAFLQKLFSYIAKRGGKRRQLFLTNMTSLRERLESRTVGKLSPVFPDKVEKIHKKVYRKLVWQYLSARRLAEAMFAGDWHFEEHLLRILKEQLQEREQVCSLGRVSFFSSRRNKKCFPLSSYYGDTCQENESTSSSCSSYSPDWQQKKLNLRRFSSMDQFLKMFVVRVSAGLLESITSRFSTQFELEQMQQFFVENNMQHSVDAQKCIEEVQVNIQWVHEHRDILHRWFLHEAAA